MGQQFQPRRPETCRSGDERLWLSTLVDTMETVSRREIRALPCDRVVLAAVHAQLARPASTDVHGASHLGLRK